MALVESFLTDPLFKRMAESKQSSKPAQPPAAHAAGVSQKSFMLDVPLITVLTFVPLPEEDASASASACPSWVG